VGLVVERAADAAAGVLPTTYFPLVCDGSGRLYGAHRTLGRDEHRAGVVWSNRDRRTLLDKMLSLLNIVAVPNPFYFVGDVYYAARKIADGLLRQNNHLITRVKSNAVAYAPHVAQGLKIPTAKKSAPALRAPRISLSPRHRTTASPSPNPRRRQCNPMAGQHHQPCHPTSIC
jgi:hypothetical protein